MISPPLFAAKVLYRYRMLIYGKFVYKLSACYKPIPCSELM